MSPAAFLQHGPHTITPFNALPLQQAIVRIPFTGKQGKNLENAFLSLTCYGLDMWGSHEQEGCSLWYPYFEKKVSKDPESPSSEDQKAGLPHIHTSLGKKSANGYTCLEKRRCR